MHTLIHVGQHKTGTTSIQRYLQDKRTELIERGLYVPDVLAGSSNPSHFMLNVYALEGQRSSPKKDRILSEHGKDYVNALAEQVRQDVRIHYQNASVLGCKDVLWTNEGLYLLKSPGEHLRLRELFEGFSSLISAVCCFRDVDSFRDSYVAQLRKQKVAFSDDRDSYRYVKDDSWLFDYEGKKQALESAFGRTIFFRYDRSDMVRTFMREIGYPIADGADYRLNVTK